MRYVASYLLAALGGNSSPSAKDIKKILDSVGIEADDDRLNKVAASQGPESPPTLYGAYGAPSPTQPREEGCRGFSGRPLPTHVVLELP